jgi:nucleoside-diphosphate-sugar epimerase
MEKKTISILGCGWYGLALAQSLISKGYSVKGSTTTEAKLSLLEQEGIVPFLIDLDLNLNHSDTPFFESDVLIISLPPRRNSGQLREYPKKMKKITDAIVHTGKVKSVLMISSTSVYADVNREVAEGEIPVPDAESGVAILEAEHILTRSESFRSTVLRFGGLIGPGRNLGKFFSGKTNIANGLAPVNLLHLDDCISLTQHIIETDAFGYTVNACSPDHPTRMDMYSNVAEITGLQKPYFLPELDKWKLINGNGATTELKYKYLVNNWSEFLSPNKL